ncbi:membrane protein insertion efficiency factor YidD [Candidatus Woesebacteria bacterium]|nr:membrane protein insertion efficiency factor YidD [Candidatus Woesebacteria bacterium]
MTKRFIILLITLYQRSFPLRYAVGRNLHLPYHPCRFSPTCSQNMLESIQMHGILKGLKIGFGQLLRCQGIVRL